MEDLQIDRRRDGRGKRQPLAHRIDHGNGVGVGLPLHAEHDGAIVVEPGRLPVVLDVLDDVRDFGERTGAPLRYATMTFWYSAAFIAAVADSVTFCCGPYSVPTGELELVAAMTAAHFVERDVACRRGHRIDLHANREFLRAVDLDLRDARQLRNLLRHPRLGEFVDLSTAAASASSR